jgi:hypothetical protein
VLVPNQEITQAKKKIPDGRSAHRWRGKTREVLLIQALHIRKEPQEEQEDAHKEETNGSPTHDVAVELPSALVSNKGEDERTVALNLPERWAGRLS